MIALLLALACAEPEAPGTAAVPEVVAPEPGPSIYALPAPLVDQDGRAVALDVNRGHPTLVTMFYASCPQACPMIVARIRALEAALPAAARDGLRVTMVSLDPERDDPAALRALADAHGLDARWTLATPRPDDVRPIAGLLGVKYRRLYDGHYNHSSVIVLVDGEGRVLARIDGLDQPDEPLLGRMRAALEGGA